MENWDSGTWGLVIVCVILLLGATVGQWFVGPREHPQDRENKRGKPGA